MMPPARAFSIRVLAGGLGRCLLIEKSDWAEDFAITPSTSPPLWMFGYSKRGTVFIQRMSAFTNRLFPFCHAKILTLGTFKRHSPLVPVLAGGNA